MYPKYKLEKLIDRYQTSMKELLGLGKWKIQVHVYKSEAKQLTDNGMKISDCRDKYGISFIGDKVADIIIFYDQVSNRKEAISTLFHEFLHCAFIDLSSLVTLNENRASKIEERLIRRLEVLCLDRYK